MRLWCLLLICSLSVHATDVISGCNSFAKDLYFALPDTRENLIMSPFSVYMALSLAYEGSSEAAAKVFQERLNLPGPFPTKLDVLNLLMQFKAMRNMTIKTANKIYLEQKFKLSDKFLDIARNYFLADAESIDLSERVAAAEKINEWIKRRTDNLISKLVSPSNLDSNTAAMLLNAIYFKGIWQKPFHENHTITEKFYVSDTETVSCSMMRCTGTHAFRDEPALEATVLRLDYIDERFSFIAVLPYQNTGLDSLERKLKLKDIRELLSKNYTSTFVEVSLPKFKIDSTADLEKPLRKLGLEKMFDAEDVFPYMVVDGPPLHVAKVIHKAFFEVDENGSKAAAATDVNMAFRIAPTRFNANHPFIFFLTARVNGRYRNESDIILFMGKIKSP